MSDLSLSLAYVCGCVGTMLWIALDELLMTTWDCSYDVKKIVVLAVKWKPVLLDKLGRLMGLSYGDADV